jgi:uncharacterized protein (DUF305 family)
MLMACSQEKKRDPGEPTPFDLYVASERLKGGFRTPADTSRSTPVNSTTGDADHDFLREMSNHHKNVIVLADAALEANKSPDMESIIGQLEERHGHELDALTAILRNAYKDRFISSPTDETRRTAELLRQSGSRYKQLFLNATIKAEQDALRIAKAYLPKGKRADVERLAAKIEGNESEEIVAMRKLLPTGEQ